MTTTSDHDGAWLDRAVELATSSVADGGGPFGALVVRDGTVVATGQNRVTRDLDPTAHAEVVAIRAACAHRGDFALDGCVLYTSCEPCPLCVSAALWARLDRVVYAADRDDAARGGFDDRAFYELLETPRSQWTMPVETLDHGRLAAPPFTPFQVWLDHEARTHY